jgi:hypothetical protein
MAYCQDWSERNNYLIIERTIVIAQDVSHHVAVGPQSDVGRRDIWRLEVRPSQSERLWTATDDRMA